MSGVESLVGLTESSFLAICGGGPWIGRRPVSASARDHWCLRGPIYGLGSPKSLFKGDESPMSRVRSGTGSGSRRRAKEPPETADARLTCAPAPMCDGLVPRGSRTGRDAAHARDTAGRAAPTASSTEMLRTRATRGRPAAPGTERRQ